MACLGSLCTPPNMVAAAFRIRFSASSCLQRLVTKAKVTLLTISTFALYNLFGTCTTSSPSLSLSSLYQQSSEYLYSSHYCTSAASVTCGEELPACDLFC